MKKILVIDTSDNKKIKVGLIIGDKNFIKVHEVDKKRAQVILPLIEKMLHEHKTELRNINEINVNPGPGSFTGIRVGLTIANLLGFLLKIPINGKPAGVMVEPIYI